MKTLSSTSAVVDALGGPAALARRLGFENESRVSNWKRGKFPAHTYLAIRAELAELGFAAPDSLWSMLPANEAGSVRRRA